MQHSPSTPPSFLNGIVDLPLVRRHTFKSYKRIRPIPRQKPSAITFTQNHIPFKIDTALSALLQNAQTFLIQPRSVYSGNDRRRSMTQQSPVYVMQVPMLLDFGG